MYITLARATHLAFTTEYSRHHQQSRRATVSTSRQVGGRILVEHHAPHGAQIGGMPFDSFGTLTGPEAAERWVASLGHEPVSASAIAFGDGIDVLE